MCDATGKLPKTLKPLRSMELGLELLAMRRILEQQSFGDSLFFFGRDPVGLGFEADAFGDPLFFFGRDPVGLGFEADAFGFSLFSLSRQAVGLGFEADAFGLSLLALRRDAISLCVEAQALGLATDACEFGFHFDPRGFFLHEGHCLFQPTVIARCERHVYRRADQCDRVSIFQTKGRHRHEHREWRSRPSATFKLTGRRRAFAGERVHRFGAHHEGWTLEEGIEAMAQCLVGAKAIEVRCGRIPVEDRRLQVGHDDRLRQGVKNRSGCIEARHTAGGHMCLMEVYSVT